VADQATIDSVKLQLPEEASEFGITDDIISAQVDATNQTKAILFCLRAIAAKVAGIEDVSESGSSRTLQFHSRLMAMITDWQARADAEDQQAGTLPAKQRGVSHTAVRV
jgi:hypothetical protein